VCQPDRSPTTEHDAEYLQRVGDHEHRSDAADGVHGQHLLRHKSLRLELSSIEAELSDCRQIVASGEWMLMLLNYLLA